MHYPITLLLLAVILSILVVGSLHLNYFVSGEFKWTCIDITKDLIAFVFVDNFISIRFHSHMFTF